MANLINFVTLLNGKFDNKTHSIQLKYRWITF